MQERTPRVEETEEERRQRQIELNRPLVTLLESRLHEDSESPDEQRAALEAVMRGVDENREDGRKIFTGLC